MNSYFFSSFKDAPENLKFLYKSGFKSLDLPHGFESYESLSCSEKTKKKICHSHEKKLHRTCIVLRNINKSRFLLNLGACCFKMESCRFLVRSSVRSTFTAIFYMMTKKVTRERWNRTTGTLVPHGFEIQALNL